MRLALYTTVLAVALSSSTSARAQEQTHAGVTLRPVDRATVRVLSLSGARPVRVRSDRTGAYRLPALPDVVHGTGVVVDSRGIVLTAAHVTRGADVVAVIKPGETEALPGRIVFVHPDYDIAFVAVSGTFPDVVPIPDVDPPLTMSEAVTASGYPLDLRERLPAAVSGAVSRVTNAGELQLAMGVNPGNSGGPVINVAGMLVGILSKRGEPRAGVENIAIVEPVSHVRAAYQRATASLTRTPPVFDATDALFARVTARFVRTSDDQPWFDPATVPLVQQAAGGPRSAEEAALVAACAWNTTLALLENRGSRTIQQLPPSDIPTAQALMSIARNLAERVNRTTPFVRFHYPIIRSILVSGGRSYAPTPQ